MFDIELERVLAKRELVREVTTEKRREGMVDTPEIQDEACCRAGRERMKICTIHRVSESRVSPCGKRLLVDLRDGVSNSP